MSSTRNASATHLDIGLQQLVAAWNTQQSFQNAVSVEEIDGGLRSAAQNSTTSMETASTYKIYIAYAALHQIEQGKYSLNTHISTGQTISDAITQMIVNSDNDSGKALGSFVDWDTANDLLQSIGITHTDLDNYDSDGNIIDDKETTAADLNLLLKKLQAGTLLNQSHTSFLLGLMEQQVWRERVPAGVPGGVTVADKPGWLANTQNDTAIVYGPKSTYIITILTSSSTTKPLATLSQQVYNYLEQ